MDQSQQLNINWFSIFNLNLHHRRFEQITLKWHNPPFLFSQVVGSQARILYSDDKGRTAIAAAFNKAVAEGQLKVSKRINIK